MTLPIPSPTLTQALRDPAKAIRKRIRYHGSFDRHGCLAEQPMVRQNFLGKLVGSYEPLLHLASDDAFGRTHYCLFLLPVPHSDGRLLCQRMLRLRGQSMVLGILDPGIWQNRTRRLEVLEPLFARNGFPEFCGEIVLRDPISICHAENCPSDWGITPPSLQASEVFRLIEFLSCSINTPCFGTL